MAFASTSLVDEIPLRDDCNWIGIVDTHVQTECYPQYVHFNSEVAKAAYRPSGASSFKLASFNVLYQGSDRSRFKDLKLVAQLINEFDLITVQEILNTDARSESHNDRLWKYYHETKDKEALKHFLLPPAMLILNELRELDPSWALILSRKAKVDGRNDIEELGFFYRGKVVKPINNEHCTIRNRPKKEGLACAIRPTKTLIGRDVSKVFGRFPFMASFQAGNFDFAYITSHIVFGSPTDEELKKTILEQAFGVSTYEGLGVGVTQATYARWAEMKVIADFMKGFKNNYKEKDIIFAGDTNLEAKFPLWETIARDAGNFVLKIDQPTTLSINKFRRDVDTQGRASNYDHFFIHPQDTKECDHENAKVHYFHEEGISTDLHRKWLIRNEAGHMTSAGKKKWERQSRYFRQKLESAMTVKNGALVTWEDEIDLAVQIFEGRVFETQLQESTYYKMYQEIISDHFPISMKCDRSARDDD